MKVQQGMLALGLGLVALAVTTPAVHADSIAYLKGGNVWLANADGSGQRQVTIDGTSGDPYRSVTQDDKGVLLAARGKRIYRFGRDGHLMNTLRVSTPNGNGADAYNSDGPLPDDEISPPNGVDVTPDGTKVAYSFLGEC